MNKLTFSMLRIIPVAVLTFIAGALFATPDSALASGAAVLLIIAFLVLIFGGTVERLASRMMSERETELENLKTAQQRARAVYEMASELGTTLDYNKVLDAALKVGTLGLRDSHSKDSRLVSMVLLYHGDMLRVASSRGLTRQDESVTIAGRAGIVGTTLKLAEPILGNDAHNDPELCYFAALQDAKSVLVIPLRAGLENYGVLVFGTPTADAFADEHVDLLTAIGTQATIALQNAVLYQNLIAEKERIIAAEEDARKKLARDLHDGPTQTVAAIAMRVNYVRKMLEKGSSGMFEELTKIEDLARQTTKEIRHMLFTLRPLVLETQGLAAALKQFSEKMKETHNLTVSVQVQTGADELIDPNSQGVIFYIVEEAVNNARKHAQANSIVVRVFRNDRTVCIEVQDDGVGFDVEAVTEGYDKRGSLGMVNMRERAELVKGKLSVDSAKGKGTKITVAMPVRAGANIPANTLSTGQLHPTGKSKAR